jgi:hypothetical protein
MASGTQTGIFQTRIIGGKISSTPLFPMTAKRERIFEALESFIENFRALEKPLLMQPYLEDRG